MERWYEHGAALIKLARWFVEKLTARAISPSPRVFLFPGGITYRFHEDGTNMLKGGDGNITENARDGRVSQCVHKLHMSYAFHGVRA